MPLLSIIVPVYNTEKYIAGCIESILNQNFADFELILIDDGSTDGSAGICLRYSETDSRVVFRHKENGGVSDARNAGIDIARGDYLLFCDSDDTMVENSLGRIMAHTLKNKLEITMCTYIMDYEDGTEPKAENINFSENMCSDMCSTISHYMRGIVPWSACRNVIRRSIVTENNIRYNKEYFSAEDCDFYFNVCKYSTKFGSINVPIIRYRAARVGSTSNTFSLRNVESISRVYDKWVRYFFDNYGRCANGITVGLSEHYYYLMIEAVMTGDDDIAAVCEKYKSILNYVSGIKKKAVVLCCKVLGIKRTVKFIGRVKKCWFL